VAFLNCGVPLQSKKAQKIIPQLHSICQVENVKNLHKFCITKTRLFVQNNNKLNCEQIVNNKKFLKKVLTNNTFNDIM
jgi:DNA polymerase III delta prime subunit